MPQDHRPGPSASSRVANGRRREAFKLAESSGFPRVSRPSSAAFSRGCEARARPQRRGSFVGKAVWNLMLGGWCSRRRRRTRRPIRLRREDTRSVCYSGVGCRFPRLTHRLAPHIIRFSGDRRLPDSPASLRAVDIFESTSARRPSMTRWVCVEPAPCMASMRSAAAPGPSVRSSSIG